MKGQDFQEMLKSIDQARAIHRGERKPSRVFHFDPLRVKKIRRKLHLTQAKFATMICVSVGTLRNWEQGRTYPEGAAIALLRVAEAEPRALLQALRSHRQSGKNFDRENLRNRSGAHAVRQFYGEARNLFVVRFGRRAGDDSVLVDSEQRISRRQSA